MLIGGRGFILKRLADLWWTYVNRVRTNYRTRKGDLQPFVIIITQFAFNNDFSSVAEVYPTCFEYILRSTWLVIHTHMTIVLNVRQFNIYIHIFHSDLNIRRRSPGRKSVADSADLSETIFRTSSARCWLDQSFRIGRAVVFGVIVGRNVVFKHLLGFRIYWRSNWFSQLTLCVRYTLRWEQDLHVLTDAKRYQH